MSEDKFDAVPAEAVEADRAAAEFVTEELSDGALDRGPSERAIRWCWPDYSPGP